MKRIFFLLFILLGFSTAVGADSVTLSTYYPAPYGAYARLRIVPSETLTGNCQHGTMYLDNTNNALRYCRDDSTWGFIPGVFNQSGNFVFLSENNSNPLLKVGIGTSTPSSTLHLEKSAEDPALQITKTGGSDFSIISQSTNTIMKTTGNTSLEVRTNDTPRVFIANDGNVGIGRTDPSALLDVKGNAIFDGDTGSTFIRFQNSNVWYSVGVDANDGNNFKINLGANIGDTTRQIVLTPQGDLIVYGKIQVKIGSDPLGEIKLRYIDDGANSGYYAVYAP